MIATSNTPAPVDHPASVGIFDHTYDVVVVGSGAAGLATAMAAADEGLRVLILEGTTKWGGNTAMSGGGMWMPNNPLMQRDGVGDSRDEALTYLEATVGDEGRATDRDRKEAFVDSVADFVTTAEKYGIELIRSPDYPDYYPELPGGKIGRALEVRPFDVNRIGDWWDSYQAPAAMPIKTDDVWLLGRAWSTPGGFVRGAQLVGRVAGGVVRGRKLAGIGAALASSLLDVVIRQQGSTLWLESPLEELLLDEERVVGVRATHRGRSVSIRATRGVMLAGGGFDRNVDWRQKYHGIDGSPSGAPGNLGGPIDAAHRVGAALELMDQILTGSPVEQTVSKDALADPVLFDQFVIAGSRSHDRLIQPHSSARKSTWAFPQEPVAVHSERPTDQRPPVRTRRCRTPGPPWRAGGQ